MHTHPINLNDAQQRAVTTTCGRVLVLAGAGSGKTSVLICRMVHLIETCKVDPASILGLTFTNKAALEMKQRIKRFIRGKKAAQIHLCTFHSFCFHLLKQEIHHLGYTNTFSIYDERDMKRVITELLRHHTQGEETPSLNDETLLAIKQLQLGEKSDVKHKAFHHVARDLPEVLRAYNAVNFDGLIELTLELFKTFPEILEKYQEKYRYIMIDEYQDTNPAQDAIATLLAKRHQNLFVVGDDDQAIYGWRGACVEYILKFQYDHLIKLEQNYRSTPIILEAANHVIGNNLSRHQKTMWCDKTQGESIHIFHAPDEEKEAEGVIMRILDLKKTHGLKWSEIAILYRSNLLSRPFEMALVKASWKDESGEYRRGIPYSIAEGSEFYTRAEVRDVLAYLKVIENPYDQEALLRIINYPRRGISPKTLDIITQYNRRRKIPLWNLLESIADNQMLADQLPQKAVTSIRYFKELIEDAKRSFQTLSLHKALSQLIDSIHLKESIAQEFKSEKAAEFKKSNIDQLLSLLNDYETHIENPSLHDFVHNTILDVQYDKKQSPNQDKLNLLTFHSAKGLEFRACFIIGVEDHLIPHEKSLLENSLEEERRLLYVAMTRAQEFLTISMARTRSRYGKPTPSNPSRFLFELPKDWLKMTSWNFPEPYDPYQTFVRSY